MLMSLTDHHPLSSPTPFWPCFSLIRGWFARLAGEIEIRRAMRRLASFDDDTLHDFGLSRGEIEDAVRRGRVRASRR